MIIACDMDGVLVDFPTGFTKLLMRINPAVKVDVYATDFPTTWDWFVKAGFTEGDIERAWTEVKNSGVFWRSLFPIISAWDDIRKLDDLRKTGNDVYFVTSRPGKTAKAESEEWLRGHGFDKPTVVISDFKEMFCESVRANILIDDKPENLFVGPDVKGFLFQRPYNKAYWDAHLRMRPVRTVREVFEILEV